MRLRNGAVIVLVFLMIAVSLSGCVYLPGEITGVSFLPIVHTFEAYPSVIKAGEYSVLSWTVTGASKVYIDNGVGNVAVQGSLPVSPSETVYYTLTALNSSGNSTARTQIIVVGSSVSQPPKQPSILYFSVDKNYVNPGGSVTLYWNTADATLVSLEPGGIVSAQGSTTVFPYVTSNYSLTASNSYGVKKSTLTIQVNTTGGIYQSGQETAITLFALPEESGALVKNNAVYTLQESVCAGDTNLNLPSRAFLSFDISGIPRNAIITEAILDLSGYTKVGNPTYDLAMYGNMGAIEIYSFQYGGLSDLDIMAYNRLGTLINGGGIIDYPASPWLVNVTGSSTGEPVIQNLVQSGQLRSQFKVQFFTTTNWDGKSDMFCFDNAKLILKYRVP